MQKENSVEITESYGTDEKSRKIVIETKRNLAKQNRGNVQGIERNKENQRKSSKIGR